MRRASLILHALALCLAVFAAACDDLPRDPKGTLKRIESEKILRVGLVEHPPFVVRSNGEPTGAEVEIVRRFVERLGAKPEWHWGGEQRQMEALENFELDLLIGGLTDETAWKSKIGLTNPYFKNHVVVGVPVSMSAPESIKGLRIAVESGDASAARLEDKNAIPVRVEDLKTEADKIPVAAPEWQLEELKLTPPKFDLQTVRYVVATAPGENAFLKRLDEFLKTQQAEVKTLLQQAEAKQSEEAKNERQRFRLRFAAGQGRKNAAGCEARMDFDFLSDDNYHSHRASDGRVRSDESRLGRRRFEPDSARRRSRRLTLSQQTAGRAISLRLSPRRFNRFSRVGVRAALVRFVYFGRCDLQINFSRTSDD